MARSEKEQSFSILKTEKVFFKKIKNDKVSPDEEKGHKEGHGKGKILKKEIGKK